jgi:hypothetical protein
MKILFIFLTLFFIFSCGKTTLNKVEQLGSFRILAIQTATPELTQINGLTVTVRPYISDIASGGRSITGTVEGCVDPGISFGANATCEGNPTLVTSSYTVDTTSAGTLHSKWGPYSSALAIPDLIFAGKSTREKFNGVPYLTIFTFVVDGLTYKSFRRVLVTNRTTPNLNTNPTLTALQLNSGPISKPNLNDHLNVSFSGVETYDYIRVDGLTETRTEKSVMAWYISDGTINISKANASESIQYQTDPPTGQLLIIGVLRDERGGVDVRENLL